MSPDTPEPRESRRGLVIIGAELLDDEIGPVIRDERQAFLYAAAEHPEIRLAESLRSTIHAKVATLPFSYWKEPFSPTAIAQRDELNNLMTSWAVRFNLGVEWVILEAWQAISLWQGHPERLNPFTWKSDYGSLPTFEFPIFLPQDEAPESYRARVLQAFTETLEGYVEDCEERYRSHKPRATRERTADVGVADRYTWAALRVCCPWSYERIARSIGHRVTARRIENAVREVCERIDLSIPNLRASKK